jgi:hypothetical protein
MNLLLSVSNESDVSDWSKLTTYVSTGEDAGAKATHNDNRFKKRLPP